MSPLPSGSCFIGISIPFLHYNHLCASFLWTATERLTCIPLEQTSCRPHRLSLALPSSRVKHQQAPQPHLPRQRSSPAVTCARQDGLPACLRTTNRGGYSISVQECKSGGTRQAEASGGGVETEEYLRSTDSVRDRAQARGTGQTAWQQSERWKRRRKTRRQLVWRWR